MRSVIKQADAAGIQDIVSQQFAIAEQISAAGLVPIIEPEVDIHCPDKAKAEEVLKAALIEELNDLPGEQWVMLKLTLPEQDDFYSPVRPSSQCRAGGGAVGRVYAGRSQPAPAPESRRRGELFAGPGRGADGPATRCRVQRPAGYLHPEYL